MTSTKSFETIVEAMVGLRARKARLKSPVIADIARDRRDRKMDIDLMEKKSE